MSGFMPHGSIFLIGVIISVAVYLVVGLLAGRRVKDVGDYYVAGRSAPTILIAGTLFASMLSTNGFMGDTGFCYDGNMTSMILLNTFCASGYVFGPIFFGRFLRRAKTNTMPEYFGKRYNDTKIQRFAGIITVISVTAYLLACITGVGILMEELTGLNHYVCLFIAWFAFTGFTFYSGSSGVILTDTIMFMVFLVATVIAGPYVFNAGAHPFSQLLNALMSSDTAMASQLLDFHGNIAGTGGATVFDAVMYAVTMGIIWLITVSVSPWQAGRNMMAKTEHVTFRAGSIAAVCTTVFLTYLYLIAVAVHDIPGGVAYLTNLGDSQRVIIWTAFNIMPKFVGTLVLAGIMAAGLSSASTFLSVIGFSMVTVVLQKKFKSDRDQLRYSRLVMLGVGVVALILAACNLGGIRIISWFASTIIAAAWIVPAVGGIFNKKMSAKGARWAMYAGFFGFIIPKCLKEFLGNTGVVPFFTVFKNLLDPFFIGVIFSILFAVIGTKLEAKSREEIAFHDNILILPQSERVHKDYARDKMYGVMLIAAGVLVTTLLLVFWALPYNGYLPVPGR